MTDQSDHGAGQAQCIASCMRSLESIARDADAALVNASPVKQYAIESLVRAASSDIIRLVSQRRPGLD